MEIDSKTLKLMPKTDLHVHLDGSLRISTILDLARQQNVKLPSSDPAILKKILVPGIKCKSLEEYLRPFDITLSVLQDEEPLSRVAF
jgi:adenosine deaminase